MDDHPTFLRQKGSGHVYMWTATLAQRDDMEPYELAHEDAIPEDPAALDTPANSESIPAETDEDEHPAGVAPVARKRGRPRKVRIEPATPEQVRDAMERERGRIAAELPDAPDLPPAT